MSLKQVQNLAEDQGFQYIDQEILSWTKFFEECGSSEAKNKRKGLMKQVEDQYQEIRKILQNYAFKCKNGKERIQWLIRFIEVNNSK